MNIKQQAKANRISPHFRLVFELGIVVFLLLKGSQPTLKHGSLKVLILMVPAAFGRLSRAQGRPHTSEPKLDSTLAPAVLFHRGYNRGYSN